jgi:integrase
MQVMTKPFAMEALASRAPGAGSVSGSVPVRLAFQTSYRFGGLRVHGLKATAATNALEHEADIAKVQAWLGHANISTTKSMIGARTGRRTLQPTQENTDLFTSSRQLSNDP